MLLSFLTVQVSPKEIRERPSNIDPKINLAIQKALLESIPTMIFAYGKRNVIVVVNAIKETFEKMEAAGRYDSLHQ